MTTTEVNYVVGNVFVKLRGLKTKIYIFLINFLPLNVNEDNFNGKWYDIFYERTVIKLYDDGWKNIFPACDDVSLIGYGCGVSQYPQVYDQD